MGISQCIEGVSLRHTIYSGVRPKAPQKWGLQPFFFNKKESKKAKMGRTKKWGRHPFFFCSLNKMGDVPIFSATGFRLQATGFAF